VSNGTSCGVALFNFIGWDLFNFIGWDYVFHQTVNAGNIFF